MRSHPVPESSRLMSRWADIIRMSRCWTVFGGMLEDSRVPTVIHCGSGPVPGDFTGPGPVREVLARHPNLILIVAHMGMPEYEGFLDLVDEFPHVYLDTTMAFTDFAEEIAPFPDAERARLRHTGERILFGSDFPNIHYEYETALAALQRPRCTCVDPLPNLPLAGHEPDCSFHNTGWLS